MKELLEYIIPNLVDHPDEVEIKETEDNGVVNITIQTNPEDVGRVIGKSGKVIKAIRQIARIVAIKKGLRVNIDIVDAPGVSNTTSVKEPLETSTESTVPEEGIDLQTE